MKKYILGAVIAIVVLCSGCGGENENKDNKGSAEVKDNNIYEGINFVVDFGENWKFSREDKDYYIFGYINSKGNIISDIGVNVFETDELAGMGIKDLTDDIKEALEKTGAKNIVMTSKKENDISVLEVYNEIKKEDEVSKNIQYIFLEEDGGMVITLACSSENYETAHDSIENIIKNVSHR